MKKGGECMTIICTEEQKKAIINARFCPFVKDCPFYSKEHGSKYLSCKQCREDNIEWKEERPQGECKTCRHRDPEDKKCDCGGLERQGCTFPVSDDYYCKYYEKGGAE